MTKQEYNMKADALNKELVLAEQRLREADCSPCKENAMNQIKSIKNEMDHLEIDYSNPSMLMEGSKSKIASQKIAAQEVDDDFDDDFDEMDPATASMLSLLNVPAAPLKQEMSVNQAKEVALSKEILEDYIDASQSFSDDELEEDEYDDDLDFYLDTRDIKEPLDENLFPAEELEEVNITVPSKKPTAKKKISKWLWITGAVVIIGAIAFMYFKKK